jgi:hypothetical protein
MRKLLALAGACALVALIGASDAWAQGKGGGRGNAGGMAKGLDRADAVAGAHGARGRAIARSRGANAFGFCPPGQRKKAGQGSRFRC